MLLRRIVAVVAAVVASIAEVEADVVLEEVDVVVGRALAAEVVELVVESVSLLAVANTEFAGVPAVVEADMAALEERMQAARVVRWAFAEGVCDCMSLVKMAAEDAMVVKRNFVSVG